MKYITRHIDDRDRILKWIDYKGGTVILGDKYFEAALLIERSKINSIVGFEKYVVDDFHGFKDVPENINDYCAFLLPWIFPTTVWRFEIICNIDSFIFDRFNILFTSFLEEKS